MTGVIVAAVVVAIPAFAWTLWPLLRRGAAPTRWLAVPPDDREMLLERKRAALAALREIDFEHESGHLSEVDYVDLRARYESEAAAVMTALDRLGVAAAAPARRPLPVAGAAARAGRHALLLGTGAAALVVFGIAIGAGITRYTAPASTEGMPPPGAPSRGAAAVMPPAPVMMPGGATQAGTPRPVPPEVLHGMLQAARASLFEGRYSEAIAAYQAVLKRDPKNTDAMTHLGLIVAIGGHADTALEMFDKVLVLDPNYPPALLYRGKVLLESKGDATGAIASWERFVAVTPPGDDRERVKQMIADARAGVSGRR